MLDIKFIRENSQTVKEAIKNRGYKIDIDGLLTIDRQRRGLLSEAEELKHRKNVASDEIARLGSNKEEISIRIDQMKSVAQKIKDIERQIEELEQRMEDILLLIPNVPHPSVPIGSGPSKNKIVREWSKPPIFNFKPMTHIELGERLGILDFPRSAKITGTGFALYTGYGARLERALINFMLDLHTREHRYKEVFPPFLVNRQSMIGTGQLPKLEEDMYRLKDDDYFLVPTAEVPITNLHRDEIIDEEELPIYYTAYTACFRREAGSYGRQTKGLTRVHQFDKVELVKFVKPEKSYDELESLLKDAEDVLQQLGLHYRVSLLCTGDLGFSASKCYDIEVWAPAAGTYLEVSSCSNFEDFQARRTNIRYRPKGSKKPAFLHTLNGSGVALARLVITLLETYQQEDGSVTFPEVLLPYMGGISRIGPVV